MPHQFKIISPGSDWGLTTKHKPSPSSLYSPRRGISLESIARKSTSPLLRSLPSLCLSFSFCKMAGLGLSSLGLCVLLSHQIQGSSERMVWGGNGSVVHGDCSLSRCCCFLLITGVKRGGEEMNLRGVSHS